MHKNESNELFNIIPITDLEKSIDHTIKKKLKIIKQNSVVIYQRIFSSPVRQTDPIKKQIVEVGFLHMGCFRNSSIELQYSKGC